MRKLTVLICTLAVALVAAGCGSSGGSDSSGDDSTTTTTEADGGDSGDEEVQVTAEEYAAAFVTSLTSGTKDDGDLVLPDDAADCVAPKFVDAMTVELLNENGITVEDVSDSSFDPSEVGIDEEQAQAVVAAFADCDFDIYAELAASLTMGMAEEVQACTAENLDRDLADALLVKSFSTGQSDAEFEALLADLESCGLPGN